MPCDGFFDDYISWIEANANNKVQCTLESVNSRDVRGKAVVTFGKHSGYLPARGGGEGPVAVHIPPTFQGVALQVFSDRAWDPRLADQLGVKITLDNSHPYVRLTLMSWGNVRFGFVPTCIDGTLRGTNADVAWKVSLLKKTAPDIR